MIRSKPLYLLVALLLLSFTPAFAGEAAVEVSGKVAAADGSPAGKAAVVAMWQGTYLETTADDSGSYKFSLKPGPYFLIAASGHLAMDEPYSYITVKDDGKVDGDMTLQLKPGAEVNGKLVDKTTGQPVGGALIMIREGLRTTTAADGSFHFDAVCKGGHTVMAKKDGFVWSIVDFSAAGQDKVELALETAPGGTVKGRVTDKDGKPIAGAIVGSGGYFYCQRTTTDKDGYYSRDGFNLNGREEIGAGADGYKYGERKLALFPSGKKEVTIDFKLESKKDSVRTITGRVVDKDGKPVAKANVSYGWSSCYEGHKLVQTDEDGRYKLEDVDDTKNLVVVQPWQRSPAFKSVEAKKDLEVDFVVEPAHWAEGKVVDKDGKPMEGVQVATMADTPEMAAMGFCSGNIYNYLDQRATTDKNGHFRLDHLPAKGLFVDVYTKGYSDIRQMPLAVDRDDHVITLQPLGQIAGTVVKDADGQPVRQFKVFLDFSQRQLPGDTSSGLPPSLVEKGVVFTADDGCFTLPNLNNGDAYAIVVEAAGFQRTRVERVKVRPDSEQGEAWPVVRLKPSAPFNGTVVDQAGKPLEGVLVTALDTSKSGFGWFQWKSVPESWRPASGRTDVDGRFSIDLAAAFGSVMLEKPGYGKAVIPNVKFSDGFKAKMNRAATVTGVVLDDQRKPVNGRYVNIESLDTRTQYDSTTTGADGKFTFTDLPAGDLLVMQHDEGRTTKLHYAILKVGESYKVDWDKMGPVVLEGKVTTKGAPEGDIGVLAYPDNTPMFVAIGRTDKQGRYKISLPRPGDYNITFVKNDPSSPYGGDYMRRNVSAKSGANKYDLRMPAASMSGRVVDVKGKPVANMKVEVLKKKTESEIYACVSSWNMQHTQPRWVSEKTVTTDSDGRFKFDALEAGAWIAAVRPSDEARGCVASEPFHLAVDKAVSGLEVKIPGLGTAEVTPVDEKGEVVKNPYVAGRNSLNMIISPNRGASAGGCFGGSCGVAAVTSEGSLKFSNLAPGRYRFFSTVPEYQPASVVVDVKPGEVSRATLKLEKGQRVVFKLTGVPDDVPVDRYWLGYKVSKPGVKEPVLEDLFGPYWGNLTFLSSQAPYETSLPLPAGDYKIQMVLRHEKERSSLNAIKDLWRDTRNIKVVPGKDVVIEVPFVKE